MMKKNISIKPSPWLTIFLFHWPKNTSAPTIPTSTIARRENGISRHTVERLTGMRPRRLVIPSMRRIFAILEPTTLPSVMSLFPRRLAMTLTVSSGSEVPNATTVRPMTRLETPNRLAIEADPSTRKSAPLTRIARPIITKRRAIIICRL